jgi:hypothetical protein
MSKRIIITVAVILLCIDSYAVKPKLYLGLRAGAGAMLTKDQLNNFTNSQGPVAAIHHHETWSFHAKGEALAGFGRFRIGYQFLYNFSGPQISSVDNYFTGDNNRNTTYFNSSQTHFFGHYLHMELAIIDLPHFALTPGIGAGTFTGFKVDNTTGNTVSISSDTHNRFSVSAELNAEVKIGRCVFLAGPNYYLFSLQDRANRDWREYQHFVGVDVGLRVNLLK